MFRTLLRKTSVLPPNNIACDAAAQRNQELFRLMSELISLREKVAQAELTAHSRSFHQQRLTAAVAIASEHCVKESNARLPNIPGDERRKEIGQEILSAGWRSPRA